MTREGIRWAAVTFSVALAPMVLGAGEVRAQLIGDAELLSDLLSKGAKVIAIDGQRIWLQRENMLFHYGFDQDLAASRKRYKMTWGTGEIVPFYSRGCVPLQEK
jgi:hypothetical protein